ncbi:3-hydroxyacyl-ACP dehydratase FabZ [Propionibacterium acidifaciens]
MSTSVITRPLPTSSTGHGESVLHDYAADRIRKMLPHRAPMLLLDRAYDVEPGVCGYGIKAVSVNEPYFAGHYPDEPIMPGVLIVEAMAQLVAVIYVSEHLENAVDGSGEDQSSRVGYLGAIRSMKFSRLVVPGDVLTLKARMGTRLGGLRTVRVSAAVGRAAVASGELIVSERA